MSASSSSSRCADDTPACTQWHSSSACAYSFCHVCTAAPRGLVLVSRPTRGGRGVPSPAFVPRPGGYSCPCAGSRRRESLNSLNSVGEQSQLPKQNEILLYASTVQVHVHMSCLVVCLCCSQQYATPHTVPVSAAPSQPLAATLPPRLCVSGYSL